MFLTMANGEALNFRVKAYATEEELLADTPSENTIGVEVDSFENYVISATAPKNPAVGLLWVQIGSDSTVNFLATRKSTIYLHPIKACIYHTPEDETDTGWKTVVSYLYANSKWNVFGRLYFFRNLKYNERVCVDWMYGYYCAYSGDDTFTSVIFKERETGIEFNCTKEYLGTEAAKGGLITFEDGNSIYSPPYVEVDLTHYKKLVFTGMFEYENSNSSVIYGCWELISGNGYKDTAAASVTITANNTEPVVVDVSALTGKYHIGFGIRSCRVRIDECYLEM